MFTIKMKFVSEILLVWIELVKLVNGLDCKSCKDADKCDTITGTFRVTVMAKGYHPVVAIPRGACNINVTERDVSNNVLALKDNSVAKYIFNGNWLMDESGNYSAVGATFAYVKQGDSCPGECIRATGPILGPVTIQLLYRDRNPGVDYRYQIPKQLDDLPRYNPVSGDDRGELRETESVFDDREQYKQIGVFPKFVPLPGPSGIHHRGPIFSSDFKYRRPQSQSEVETNSYKLFQTKPKSGRQQLTDVTYSRGIDDDTPRLEVSNEINHNVIIKQPNESKLDAVDDSGNELPDGGGAFEWTRSHYTNCSRSCGGGMTKEVHQCRRLSDDAIVDDVHCSSNSRPDVQHRVCNPEPCTPRWNSGSWSECSVSCGQGVQSRDVTCEQRISAIQVQNLDEIYCGNSKPASQKLCYLDDCYRWFVDDWSECSVECGEGQSNRTVECQDMDGNKVGDSFCSLSKPASVKECTVLSCSPNWYYTQWIGKCSADCKHGVILRDVQCIAENGLVLSDSECDASEKPPSANQCHTGTNCGGHWFTGPWSECSRACGVGKMTRQVVCIRNVGDELVILQDSNCNMDEKPLDERDCSVKDCDATWFRTKWSKCSQTCGSGVRTRSVLCMDRRNQQISECDMSQRPAETQKCNTMKCQQRRTHIKRGCSDRYPNCHVVVQAKLCRYPYYQRKCCKSCSGLKRLY